MTAKVFISSTGKDLAEYRKVAREVCKELGLAVISIKTFEAISTGTNEAANLQGWVHGGFLRRVEGEDG